MDATKRCAGTHAGCCRAKVLLFLFPAAQPKPTHNAPHFSTTKITSIQPRSHVTSSNIFLLLSYPNCLTERAHASWRDIHMQALKPMHGWEGTGWVASCCHATPACRHAVGCQSFFHAYAIESFCWKKGRERVGGENACLCMLEGNGRKCRSC